MAVPFVAPTTTASNVAFDVAATAGAPGGGNGAASIDICNGFVSSGSTSCTSPGNGTYEALHLAINADGSANINPSFIGAGVGGTLTIQSSGGLPLHLSPSEKTVFNSTGFFSTGGTVQIFNNSLYTTDAPNLALNTVSAGPELLLGADNTNNIAYIQPAHQSNDFNLPLAIAPNGGNVGIGTITPHAYLSIGNHAYTAPFGTSYGQYQLLLYDTGTPGGSAGFGIESGYMGLQSLGGYKFYNQEVPMMVIGGAGSYNVGIGGTTPSHLLEVDGDIGNAHSTTIPGTALGYEGPAAGYMLSAPAPSSAGCLYQNGSGTYSWAACSGGTPLASPTFTGTPAAPTATPSTNTTQIATTAFVQAVVPQTQCSYNTRSSANTGSTTENPIWNCAISAGTLGTVSRLEGKFYPIANSTGTCAFRVRWNTSSGSTSGTEIAGVLISGVGVSGWTEFEIFNTGSLTEQNGNWFRYGNSEGDSAGNFNSSLDTGTTETYVTVTMQNSNSGDNCYVNSGSVVLWPNG
jgi:hypothetical protein